MQQLLGFLTDYLQDISRVFWHAQGRIFKWWLVGWHIIVHLSLFIWTYHLAVHDDLCRSVGRKKEKTFSATPRTQTPVERRLLIAKNCCTKPLCPNLRWSLLMSLTRRSVTGRSLGTGERDQIKTMEQRILSVKALLVWSHSFIYVCNWISAFSQLCRVISWLHWCVNYDVLVMHRRQYGSYVTVFDVLMLHRIEAVCK